LREAALLSSEGWMQKFYAAPIDFGGGVPGMHLHMD
jgi:hypothetical protein